MRKALLNGLAAAFFVAIVLVVSAMYFMEANVGPSASVTSLFGKDAVRYGWPAPTPQAHWPEPSQVVRARSFAHTHESALAKTDGRTTHQMTVTSYGWPVPILYQAEYWWPVRGLEAVTIASADTGTLVLGWSLIWPPVTTGVIVSLSLFLPAFVRRQLRLRRGQCQWCGYPGNPPGVCSECGGDDSTSPDSEKSRAVASA